MTLCSTLPLILCSLTILLHGSHISHKQTVAERPKVCSGRWRAREKKGLDRRIMGGREEGRRPTRPLGRPPYSPSFFLFVLGKPRFGLPWISLLLLGMPTAATSRARFCLCGNRPGPPFVSLRQVETLRVRRARPGAVSREWRPGDLAHSRSLLLTRPMDSMLGIHRDHASGPHDLCNDVSVARDES